MSFEKVERYKLPNGMSIQGYPGTDYIIDEVWNRHCYDESAYLERGATVLDIGANQGVFSIYAAEKGCEVYGYEPCSLNYDILRKNIDENRLHGRVKLFNIAVSDNNSSLDIYIPETEHCVSSGMVTTKKGLIEGIKNKTAVSVSMQSVACITLDNIIKQLVNREDIFLKIDCEGAEYDILKGLSPEMARHIKYVAMELHESYDEMVVCNLLNRLGFVITQYEKINGYYSNGFLFAVRQSLKDNDIKPVAILPKINYSLAGKDILLSGEKSFILNGNDSVSLQRRWFINGNEVKSSEVGFNVDDFKVDGFKVDGSNVNHVKFLPDEKFAEGVVEVCLEISANNKTDRDRCKFIVLPSDYFKRPVDITLPGVSEKATVTIDKKTTFRIAKENIPKHWQVSKLHIRIEPVENSQQSSGDPTSHSIDPCAHYATDYPNQSEVIFFGIAQDIDFLFCMDIDKLLSFNIIWWVSG